MSDTVVIKSGSTILSLIKKTLWYLFSDDDSPARIRILVAGGIAFCLLVGKSIKALQKDYSQKELQKEIPETSLTQMVCLCSCGTILGSMGVAVLYGCMPYLFVPITITSGIIYGGVRLCHRYLRTN